MNLTVQFQKLGIIAARIIPLRFADRIAIRFSRCYYYFLKKKRGYIEKNLCHIFAKDKITTSEFNCYVKKTFENFALCMVDFLRLAFLKKEEIIKSVKAIGVNYTREALKLQRGFILLTLHLGNWDFAGSYLAAVGLPMSALVEETVPEMLNIYTRMRERTGMRTFSIKKSGYAFLDAINNNCALAILADRDVAKNGIPVDFFSGKRNIPKGLGRIVAKKQFPVLFGYMVLNPGRGRHRYLGIIEKPVFFKTSKDFNKFMVKKYEWAIRKYPDQWFVFHPEWIGE